MSCTSIYRLGREPECIGETRNAWRGAMYVWNDVAKRYFGLSRFPLGFGGEQDDTAEKIWNRFSDPLMPQHERIVLASTMDNAVAFGRDAASVAEAFDRYGREHPDSSLAEQAAIIRSADIQPDDMIAFQQTSVAEFWGSSWDEKNDELCWYDPAEGKHFDFYAEATRNQEAAALAE